MSSLTGEFRHWPHIDQCTICTEEVNRPTFTFTKFLNFNQRSLANKRFTAISHFRVSSRYRVGKNRFTVVSV